MRYDPASGWLHLSGAGREPAWALPVALVVVGTVVAVIGSVVLG